MFKRDKNQIKLKDLKVHKWYSFKNKLMKFRSRQFLISLLISLYITFGLVNIMLIILMFISSNFLIGYLTWIIVSLIVILFMVYFSSLNVKTSVLANKYPTRLWQVSVLVSLAIQLIYIPVVMSTPLIVYQLGKNLFTVVGIISGLIAFGIKNVSEEQVLEIRIMGNKVKYLSDTIQVNKEDSFKVCALCNGNNEESAELIGFCRWDDVDYIQDRRDSYDKKIFCPQYRNGHKMIPFAELIMPHCFGNEYNFEVESIIEGGKEIKKFGNDENELIVSPVFRDSDGNHYFKRVVIKLKN